MPTVAQQIRDKLEQTFHVEKGFRVATLLVENESGNHNVAPGSETHFTVTIVSDVFDSDLRMRDAGSPLGLVARHQLVYQALADLLTAKGGTIHALSIYPYTEQEWEMLKANGNSERRQSPQCLGGSRKEHASSASPQSLKTSQNVHGNPSTLATASLNNDDGYDDPAAGGCSNEDHRVSSPHSSTVHQKTNMKEDSLSSSLSERFFSSRFVSHDWSTGSHNSPHILAPQHWVSFAYRNREQYSPLLPLSALTTAIAFFAVSLSIVTATMIIFPRKTKITCKRGEDHE